MRVIPIGLRSPLAPGDDLVEEFLRACSESGVEIVTGDVVAIATKAVSAVKGLYIRLSDVRPSGLACELAREVGMSPEFVQAVLNRADQTLGCVRHAILTVVGGTVAPNAGLDAKNAPRGTLATWPEDPDLQAWRIREEIRRRTQARVGVILVDSSLIPLRRGTVGLAVGVAGMEPLVDYRGRPDIYGRTIRITSMDLADSLASAAHAVMGEGDELTPFALIKGARVKITDSYGKDSILLPQEHCAIIGSLTVGRFPLGTE